MKRIFGPVPSRRLGLSLGVDIVPAKTCTFDCPYCECGPTTRRISEPVALVPGAPVLQELAEVLTQQEKRIDYVTLSGAGEPTLNIELGRIVEGIKELTDAPVAVLTNSSLLGRPQVAAALKGVDLIMPSLDSAVEVTFQRLNRPHPDVKLDQILGGLFALRSITEAEIWLEILFADGVNDSAVEIEALQKAIERIDPHRIQLNTVDRPPAEDWIKPVDFERLKELAGVFGPRAEVIARPPRFFRPAQQKELAGAVMDLIDRRPCTRGDLKVSLGCDDEEISEVLKVLMVRGRVREEILGDRIFLRGVPKEEGLVG